MRRVLGRSLTAGAAIVAATALAALPAAAAQQSITIINPNPDGAIEAHSDFAELTDESTRVGFTCESTETVNVSNIAGTILSESYTDVAPTNPVDVGDIEQLDLSNCNSWMGPTTITSHDLPYHLSITSYDSTTGEARGHFGPVNMRVSMAGCEFDVVGHAPFGYAEDDFQGTLSMGGALEADVQGLTTINVRGCTELVAEGDEWSHVADYVVTNPVDPPVTITSS